MITDKLLKSWIRCRRKAWLECHGDHRQKIWTAHQRLQLDHQQKSFKSLLQTNPAIGIEGCQQGYSAIFGLQLKKEFSTGQIISIKPPFLQKVSGKSIWGDFQYRPVLARQGKRTTRELRLLLTLTGALLEDLQKSNVANGITISKTNKGVEIEKISLNENLKQQLNLSLLRLNHDLTLKSPPPITLDRKKCALCSWQNFCDSEAKTQGLLSEVSGIGHRRREILERLGINSIKDLAKYNPYILSQKLKNFGSQTEEIAYQLISQAETQIKGHPKRINNHLVLPELNYASGVLIYDIESDSDAKQDFLHGFVYLKKDSDGNWNVKDSKYHPILMLYQDKESNRWRRIKRKLDHYKYCPILHYGETEAIAIKKNARKQRLKENELKELENRLIDIHLKIRNHWLLPVKNYGLKTIAEWVGFRWTQSNPDGARALLWWRQWLGNDINKKRNLTSLRKIFTYNKDDCLATWAVADWLLKQDTDS